MSKAESEPHELLHAITPAHDKVSVSAVRTQFEHLVGSHGHQVV